MLSKSISSSSSPRTDPAAEKNSSSGCTQLSQSRDPAAMAAHSNCDCYTESYSRCKGATPESYSRCNKPGATPDYSRANDRELLPIRGRGAGRQFEPIWLRTMQLDGDCYTESYSRSIAPRATPGLLSSSRLVAVALGSSSRLVAPGVALGSSRVAPGLLHRE